MSLMNVDVYDALLSANADEQKARKAAISVADYEKRFHNIERQLSVLTWMVSTLIVLVASVIWRVYT